MALDEDLPNPADYWTHLARDEEAGRAWPCPCRESNPGSYDTCYHCQRPGGPQ